MAKSLKRRFLYICQINNKCVLKNVCFIETFLLLKQLAQAFGTEKSEAALFPDKKELKGKSTPQKMSISG